MSNILLNYTAYLTSKSSFLTGVGSIFDFSGSYQAYNASSSELEADAKAIFLDWLSVGDDMRSAAQKFGDDKQGVYESV